MGENKTYFREITKKKKKKNKKTFSETSKPGTVKDQKEFKILGKIPSL